MSLDLNDIRRVHFIGIGGIGMSAIARYFMHRGTTVTGYDKVRSELTNELSEEGALINYRENVEGLDESIDLIVYTPAVPSDHKELVRSKELGLPVQKRSEVLGKISREFETMAVAGTHGKTTTSILLNHLYTKLGKEPNSFLGGIPIASGSNFQKGGSKIMITEADEYDRSFLKLKIDRLILTSLDADHLDIYSTREEMIDAYKDLVSKLPTGGSLIAHEEVLDELKIKDFDLNHLDSVKSYGRGKEADYQLLEMLSDRGEMRIRWKEREQIENWETSLAMPGEHNALNAMGALALALDHGLSPSDLNSALVEFKGIRRRFEKRYDRNDITIIDDYAHHPTEIKAAINAARWLYPGRTLHVVFQAHLYSRTRDFMKEFVEELSRADVLWICEIYPAREEALPGISGEVLLEKVGLNRKHYVLKKQLDKKIKLKEDDVLLVLGAGNIDSIIPEIINRLETQH